MRIKHTKSAYWENPFIFPRSRRHEWHKLSRMRMKRYSLNRYNAEEGVETCARGGRGPRREAAIPHRLCAAFRRITPRWFRCKWLISRIKTRPERFTAPLTANGGRGKCGA